LALEQHEALGAFGDHEDIQRLFPNTYGRPRVSVKSDPFNCEASRPPLRIGVVLSGGQAPGGHNVIAGIYDFIKKYHPDSALYGFLDGPQGVYKGIYAELTQEIIDFYRNSGGFDMIGSGRHKIEKAGDMESSMRNCMELGLNGLVVIGGDDSNTNAAVLAEYFEANECPTKVCGCPKTIDGDLKVHPYIPISFGFDTACKTYSELVGNVCVDTLSSQKYYHFVRLMGRAASNIALECALLTRPNVCLISEEVQAKQQTLFEVTHEIVNVILARADMGKDYGVILLPEGLIEFIPEFNVLIDEINDVLEKNIPHEEISSQLTESSRNVFEYLPALIKEQLLLDRDPHGNVQVAKIETERLLAQTVSLELGKYAAEGRYKGEFSPQFHSYGYEGRSCLPSSFDSIYCNALGQNVAALIACGQNGLISSVTNLTAPVSEWACAGVPITMMCHMEKRHAHMKPVINKALVDLSGEPFKCFAASRADWALYDLYRSPGPIQFYDENGNEDHLDLCVTLTLELNKGHDERMNPSNVYGAIARQQLQQLPTHKMQYSPFTFAPNLKESAGLLSQLQQHRAQWKPVLMPVLSEGGAFVLGQPTQCRRFADRQALKTTFPLTYGAPIASMNTAPSMTKALPKKQLKIGFVFCGRQAPGGHDVLSGLYDALQMNGSSEHGQSELIGFVGGTIGLISNHHVVITQELLECYRGQGGYSLLCRSSDKIDTSKFDEVRQTCVSEGLCGLILAGSARTCTYAAHLSEYFRQHGCSTSVLVVPLDTSNGLKSEYVETTVGFDTVTKVSAQVAANNATDGASAKKYYYFMRLLGDEPSHCTLEVALQTKPNFVILGEEVSAKRLSLNDIVHSIADMICARAQHGKNYGVVLMPEGLVEFIPELRNLINEIDALYSALESVTVTKENTKHLEPAYVKSKLTLWSRAILDSLPDFMQSSLVKSRGSDNNIQLSQAQTKNAFLFGRDRA
jgi:diphosphate--fructose-6-phosphate 1-phosphotransferase